MNLVNKILILVILVFLINHLTNGRIIDTLTEYYNMCIKSVESFTGINSNFLHKLTDVNYSNIKTYSGNTSDTYQIYDFLNNLVTPDLGPDNQSIVKSSRIISDTRFEYDLKDHLMKIFNCRGYRFNNIKLLNKISYYETSRGKEIEPFSFSAIVSHLGKDIGTLTIYVESFLKESTYDNTGFLIITNIRLQDQNYIRPTSENFINHKNVKYQLNDRENRAINESKDMTLKMTDSFNNYFVNRNNFDDLFIKPNNAHKAEGFLNDTENSLIPSVIDMSNSYEQSSDSSI